MSLKVSAIWRLFTFILIGFSLGVYVSLKYISPPTQDINIGKIKIKGRGNSLGTVLDISTPKPEKTDVDTSKEPAEKLNFWQRWKAKRQAKKEARKAKKAKDQPKNWP